MKTTVIHRLDKDGNICTFFPYVRSRSANVISGFDNCGHFDALLEYYLSTKKAPDSMRQEIEIRERLLRNYYGYDIRAIRRICWHKRGTE